MFPTTTPSNTGAGLVSQDALNAAKIWKKGADYMEREEDVFQSMEGGENALIQVENSLSAGAGHEIYFRVTSGFYGPGKRSAQYFTSEDDFEPIDMKTNSLKVGVIRNATRTDMVMEEELGMRGEIDNTVHRRLGSWMGREKTRQMGLSFLHQVNDDNHIYANQRGSVDDLTTGDELSPDDLVIAGAMLEGLGGRPAHLGKDPLGNSIHSLLFLTSQHGSSSLEMDPENKANQRAAAGANGYNNRLFKGGLIEMHGHKVKKWVVEDHDGVGAIGSFLNPKAYLGIPIVDGTTADLTGAGRGITGGNSSTNAARRSNGIQFFVDFPRLAYTFCNGDTISATSSTHQLNADNKFYVVIVNSTRSSVDASIRGKCGVYRVSANNGNELTVDQRLVAPADVAGIGASTVGSVVWDATKHTTVHPSGSLVYLANQYGKPLFRTLALGQRSARRGYGMFRNLRMTDKQEGGFIREVYIASIFGQKPVADRIDRFPGVLVIHHTGKYPGWNTCNQTFTARGGSSFPRFFSCQINYPSIFPPISTFHPSMKVLAIITLAQPLSRSGSDRWGQFLRAHGEREHLWLGRPLTPEEFNVEFPKALKFAGADRPLVGRILVEPEGAGEDVLPSMLVSEHDAKVAEIQEGVNEWAAEQNAKLEAAAARIEELELLLASKPDPAQTGDSAEKQSEDKISADADGPVPESNAEGSDPVPAGVQVPDQPTAPEAPEPTPSSDLPPPEPEVKPAKAAAKKAKAGK